MADFVIFNIDIADATAKKNDYSTTLLLEEFEYNDSTGILKTGVYFTDDGLSGGNKIRTKTFASLLEVAEVFNTTSYVYKAATTYFSQRLTPENLIIGQVRGTDTTRATALNAIIQENNKWFIICDLSADDTDAQTIAAWAEANDKTFIYLSNDSDNIGSGSSDIISILKGLEYNNTEVIQSQAVDSDGDLIRNDVALASYWGALTPGLETQKFLNLVGCTAVDSDSLGVSKYNTTNITNVLNKYGNLYVESNTNRNIFIEGTAVSGRFMDITRYSKYLKDELTAEVSLLFIDPGYDKKIPYTDKGVGRVVNAISKILDRELKLGKLEPFVAYDSQGRPTTTPYKITTIPVSEVSTSDKNARLYNGISIQVRYSSAIHKVVNNITMVV